MKRNSGGTVPAGVIANQMTFLCSRIITTAEQSSAWFVKKFCCLFGVPRLGSGSQGISMGRGRGKYQGIVGGV